MGWRQAQLLGQRITQSTSLAGKSVLGLRQRLQRRHQIQKRRRSCQRAPPLQRQRQCPLRCRRQCPLQCQRQCPLQCQRQCPLQCRRQCPLQCQRQCPLQSQRQCPLQCRRQCPLLPQCPLQCRRQCQPKRRPHRCQRPHQQELPPSPIQSKNCLTSWMPTMMACCICRNSRE